MASLSAFQVLRSWPYLAACERRHQNREEVWRNEYGWDCHFSGDDLIFFEKGLRMGPKRPRRAGFGCLPPTFYLLRRSWRCSLAYSSSSDTPNSNSMMPQKTSRDDSKRARLLYGIISP